MSFQYPARVKQTTATTGTGPLVLLSPPGQYRSFQTHFGSGPVVLLYVIAGQGYFEYGYGTYTAPGSLTRDTVIESSNSGSKVSLPAATSDVFADWPAESRGLDLHTGDYTLTLADRGNFQQYTNSSAALLNLPALSTVPTGFDAFVCNDGTSTVTIDSAGTDTIMGNATLVLQVGQCGILHRDGTEWKFRYFSNFSPVGAPSVLATGNVVTGSLTFLTLNLTAYANYKRIEVHIENLRLTTAAGGTFGMQFSTNGGSSWVTSGYNDGTSSPPHSQLQVTGANIGAGSSTDSLDLQAALLGFNQAIKPRAVVTTMKANDSNVTQSSAAIAGGSLPGTTNANAVKFFYSGSGGDNVTAGTYRVVGYP
jgi:hypothetical protein